MREATGPDVRLDTWLWRARFFKTRALASAHVTAKGIRLTRGGQTRKIDKPGMRLQPGDILTFMRGKALQNVEFIAAGTRRGPASEAQTLYRITHAEEN